MIYKGDDVSLCVVSRGTDVDVHAVPLTEYHLLVPFRKGDSLDKVRKGVRLLIEGLGKVPSTSLINDVLSDPVFTRSYKGTSYPMTVRNTAYAFLMNRFKVDPSTSFKGSVGEHTWHIQKDMGRKGILCTGHGYLVGAYFSKGKLTIVTYTGDPQEEAIRALAECLAYRRR